MPLARMVSGTWLAPFFLELEKECWGTGAVSRMSNLSKRNLEAKRGCKFASVLGIRRFQVRKRLFQLPPGVLALGHSCAPQCTWSWSHTKTAGAVLQAKLGQEVADVRSVLQHSKGSWSEAKKNPWPDEKCLILFTFLCVSVGSHGKAWKNRRTKKIFPERPAFDCGGLCPWLFIEIGYPVVKKKIRLSMILPMTACVAQPILHRELFKQRVPTFFDVLQRRLIRPIRGTHAGCV